MQSAKTLFTFDICLFSFYFNIFLLQFMLNVLKLKCYGFFVKCFFLLIMENTKRRSLEMWYHRFYLFNSFQTDGRYVSVWKFVGRVNSMIKPHERQWQFWRKRNTSIRLFHTYGESVKRPYDAASCNSSTSDERIHTDEMHSNFHEREQYWVKQI